MKPNRELTTGRFIDNNNDSILKNKLEEFSDNEKVIFEKQNTIITTIPITCLDEKIRNCIYIIDVNDEHNPFILTEDTSIELAKRILKLNGINLEEK